MRPALKVALGGLVAVLVVGLPTAQRLRWTAPPLAATNAQVDVSSVALPLGPGARACTPDVEVPASTRAVRVFPGFADGRLGPRVRLTVRVDDRGRGRGRILARTIVSRYRSEQPAEAPLRIARTEERALVCLENLSRRPVQFAAAYDNPQSFGAEPVLPVRFDMLATREQRPRYALASVVIERAANFKARVVHRWTVVAALLVPALLAVMALLIVGRRRA